MYIHVTKLNSCRNEQKDVRSTVSSVLCICLTAGIFLSRCISGRVANYELQHMFKWFAELGPKNIEQSKFIFHGSEHMRKFCFLIWNYGVVHLSDGGGGGGGDDINIALDFAVFLISSNTRQFIWSFPRMSFCFFPLNIGGNNVKNWKKKPKPQGLVLLTILFKTSSSKISQISEYFPCAFTGLSLLKKVNSEILNNAWKKMTLTERKTFSGSVRNRYELLQHL